VVRLIQETYQVLGFQEYSYRLSLRDPGDLVKFEDNEEMWQKSEAALRAALEQLGLDYYIGIGDAAFYGPKLDVQVANVLGKDETISTVQLDFTLPERFDLEYIGEDGQAHRPVMIHRGVLSTMERIMAFLIENYAGNFPVWLAPVQAVVIPIADRHAEYARHVEEELKAAGLRVEVDLRSERMNAKVRDAQLQKVPYMLVVGDKEEEADSVALRLRTNENIGPVPLADFVAIAGGKNATRSLELWP
jgi:threonyl-tRNA synthetase